MGISNPTPAQMMSQRLFKNSRLMEDIVRLKNSIIGLSPETRNKFQEFKELAWEDIKHQKRQKEMYQEENREAVKQVQALNLKIQSKIKYDRHKTFQKEIKEKIREQFTCFACKDTGEKDAALGFVAYCVCPAGIEKMYGPNWKQTDDKVAWVCTNCKTLFSKRKIHECITNIAHK